VASPVISCGTCDRCTAGLRDHCRERTIVGLMGREGCFADRFVMPASALAVVPDSLDDDRAVFAVDVAAALQAARQLTIVGKPYITVLGDSALALITAQVMSKLNASVRVIGGDATRLAAAEKAGLKHRLVEDVGRRGDQDVVVDCTGTPAGFELALQLVRPRGKIVLKSLPLEPLGERSPNLTPLALNEIEVIGSFAGPVGEALRLLERDEIEALSLITRRYSLNEGVAALRAAAQQPGAIKVILEV
jgi:threonine dehydrogenase-like Zn-dependent dehydrogenase